MASEDSRSRPNILVTGTPGTGKTTTASAISEELGFEHVNIGSVVKAQGLHGGKDGEFDAYILDEEAEDKIIDALEDKLSAGGVVVDHHTPGFFPERWFDLVLVLRAETHVLYDRLVARGYNKLKLDENMEAEIMQVVLEEARESYPSEVVHEVHSNSTTDMDATVQRVLAWERQWRLDHSK